MPRELVSHPANAPVVQLIHRAPRRSSATEPERPPMCQNLARMPTSATWPPAARATSKLEHSRAAILQWWRIERPTRGEKRSRRRRCRCRQSRATTSNAPLGNRKRAQTHLRGYTSNDSIQPKQGQRVFQEDRQLEAANSSEGANGTRRGTVAPLQAN